jgi:hypothetical protein
LLGIVLGCVECASNGLLHTIEVAHPVGAHAFRYSPPDRS